MNITIKTVPHNQQRYETVGDWWWNKGNLEVRVSDMGNPHYEWFVAEHEINEALLCEKFGINENVVSAYDIAFEKLREKYSLIIGNQEPGNMISSPYNKQHEAATEIEKLTCKKFGCSWEAYDQIVNSL